MKRCIALFVSILTASMGLLSVPAGADTLQSMAGVRFSVTRIGDLLINGDGAANAVIIVEGENAGELGFIVDGDIGDAPELSLAVSRNVRVNLGGGADSFTVAPGVQLPGSLIVATGSAGPTGVDEIALNGATIPGVTSLRFVGAGSLRSGGTVFGGTVVIRGGNGDFEFCDGICSGDGGSSFEKNVRINSGRRGSFVVSTGPETSVAVRMTVIGGTQGAELNLSGDLGLNPVLRTLNGDDRWTIDGATWTGKLRGITSTGDDQVSLIGPQPQDGPLLFNVNLGRGNDVIGIDAGFDPASRANGTAGNDEACDLSGVLLGTFESVSTEDCAISFG